MGPTSASRPFRKVARFRPALEKLEDRNAPSVGVFSEDFSNDADASRAGFDSWDDSPATPQPDELQILNDLPRYGAAPEGPTGRGGYYMLRPGTPGDPGWGLLADGHVLNIFGGSFGVPQLTFSLPAPGTPGGPAAGEHISGIGLSAQGFGVIEVVGANGVLSVVVGGDRTWRRIAFDRDDLLPSGLELGEIRSLRVYSDIELELALDIVSVQISRDEANEPPHANDDLMLVDRRHGYSAAFNPLANDFDPNGDGFAIVAGSIGGPTYGTLDATFDAFDNFLGFRYRPHPRSLLTPGFREDSFTYTIRDTQGATDTAKVRIVLNQAPVARRQVYHLSHGRTGPFEVLNPRQGVLRGAFDPDRDPFTLHLVQPPQHGNVDLRLDGTFVYTSNLPDGRNVADRFTFRLHDGYQYGEIQSAELFVPNLRPTLLPGTFRAPHFHQDPFVREVMYIDADGDPVTPIVTQSPGHGRVTLAPVTLFGRTYIQFTYISNTAAPSPVDGSFRPTIGRDDSFRFKINDGYADSNEVTVRINSFNFAPSPMDELHSRILQVRYKPHVARFSGAMSIERGAYLVPKNSPGTTFDGDLRVLASDIDPDGDAIYARMETPPAHGTVTLRDDGSFTYVPHADYTGMDSFTYRAHDLFFESRPATVNIRVVGPPTVRAVTVSHKTVDHAAATPQFATQRSRVGSIRLYFHNALQVGTEVAERDIRLDVLQSSGWQPYPGELQIHQETDLAGRRTIVWLHFNNPTGRQDYLPDGRYRLVFANAALGYFGQRLDGDFDGTEEGEYVYHFHVLFGDGDGDGDVDAVDDSRFPRNDVFFRFLVENYRLAYFSYTPDGDIDQEDEDEFDRNLGRVI